MNNETYELVKVENNEITIDQKFINDYKEFKKLQLKMELAEKEFKEVLKEKMQELGKTSLIKDGMSIIYKKATTRTSIDTTRLKTELPEIYENYSKTSDVSASISISVEL
jgi:predicted phage-related endonuclease